MISDQPPSSRRARGRIEYYSEVPRARVRKEFLLNCVRHASRRIPNGFESLCFILVGDRKMARLHRTFAGVSGTTDVLTFDLTDPDSSRVEGEVYICLDQARRQAKSCRVPLYEEVARLAVHGVLHLAGCEDGSESDRERMRKLENRSLEAGRRS